MRQRRPVRKAISAPTIHFKGSGWAKKDRGASATGKSSARGVGRRSSSGGRRRPADGARRRSPASTAPTRSGGRARDRHPARRRSPTSSGSKPAESSGSSAGPSSGDRLMAGVGGRLDQPGRGGRDPRGREHPLPAVDDRRLGPRRASSRASSSAAAGSSGGARSGRSSRRRAGSGRATSSPACSRRSGTDRTTGAPRVRAPGPASRRGSSRSRPRSRAAARGDRARRVFDRFGSVDGCLLAAGVSYNAFFALIPLRLFVTGVAGLILTDAASRAAPRRGRSPRLPAARRHRRGHPRRDRRASPSASIIGLVLAGWGTAACSRRSNRRSAQLDHRRAAPRLRPDDGSPARRPWLVVGGILILAARWRGAGARRSLRGPGRGGDAARPLLELLLAVVPPILAAVALVVVYRIVPLVRPSWRAIVPPVPGIVGGSPSSS